MKGMTMNLPSILILIILLVIIFFEEAGKDLLLRMLRLRLFLVLSQGKTHRRGESEDLIPA